MKTTEESAVRERQTAEPQFAAFVAIDWADQEHVWCLQVAGSEQSEKGRVKNTPEAVETWIAQLCQRFPTASIAVAIEKCRGQLILLLSRPSRCGGWPRCCGRRSRGYKRRTDSLSRQPVLTRIFSCLTICPVREQ